MTIALAFLNPLLLWGLPLAAVPIVIHLLNRRRFDTRRWAAMEFLLRAMKRNRRRIQMEQWLVLLLRTLAILLLVMLVSRPRLTGGILGGDATHHIVCIDDSASMAHRGGADDAMDRAHTAVERLATRLATEREGDVLTLVVASATKRPALAVVPVAADLPRRVREALAAIHTGDQAFDPNPTFAALTATATAAREIATRAEYYVVSDLRRHDWANGDGAPNPAFVAWLAGLDGELEHLTLVDVGARDAENLAVTAVRVADRVCVAGVPVRIAVDVRNRGRAAAEPLELTIDVDGSRFVRPVPSVGPGETATVEFEQTFRAAGWHGITASLPNDRFVRDDVRYLALDVRAATHALLVDGDPGEELESAETFYLNVALAPGGDTVTGVDVRLIAEHELAAVTDAELADLDIVWLCNVSRFSPETVAKLEAFVRSGGGLVIWLGEQVDVGNYDELLWKSGQGLLPTALESVEGDTDAPRHVHFVDLENPVFTKATDELRLMFGELVLVGRWIRMRSEPDPKYDVLLRVGDADGPALLVGKSFGDGGKVFVSGTTADASWTDWAAWPAFPIVVDRLQATASRPQDLARNDLRPDGSYTLTVDPAVHRPDVTVRPHERDGESQTFAAPPNGSAAVTVALAMAEIDGTGLFDVVRNLHSGGEDVTLIARNPLAEEGDVEPITSGALAAGLPTEVRDRVTFREGATSADTREISGGGIWQMLAAAMLLGMLAESVLAWRFGRR